MHPCSTASKELDPLSNKSHAFFVAFFTSQVAITNGNFLSFTLGSFISKANELGMPTLTPSKELFLINPLLFIN